MTMVPLLELANHADPGNANAHVDRLPDGSWVFLNATANISAGEEVISVEVLADIGHVSWQIGLHMIVYLGFCPALLSCTEIRPSETRISETMLFFSTLLFQPARQCASS